MTTEEIIKRYQLRSGYRLADFAEVALPIYSVNAQALTMAHRRLPPIEEFILRCLSKNICSTTELSQFLGLEEEVIKSALAGLAQTDSIALTAPKGMQAWTLTNKGNSTLETAELVIPEERSIPVHFDALTRKPTLYRFQRPMRHHELEDEGLIEIEQIPPKRPQLSEITPFGIERVIRKFRSESEESRDVLAVRTLENVKRQYIKALALLFKSTEADDRQIAFVIDGKLSRDHEMAFADSAGFRRLAQSFRPDAAEQQELANTADSSDSDAIAKNDAIHDATVAAEIIAAEATHELQVNDNPNERDLLREKLQAAEEELVKLRDEARRLEVRNLYLLDHPPLLNDALLNAQERLMIISPWIRADIVTKDFIRNVEELLRRNVAVYIGYGIAEEHKTKARAKDIAAVESLRKLRDRYPHYFSFIRFGNTHAKVLIKDHDFAAITSFNWLSFKGDANRPLRDEQGTLYQSRNKVDQKFDELLPRFNTAHSP